MRHESDVATISNESVCEVSPVNMTSVHAVLVVSFFLLSTQVVHGQYPDPGNIPGLPEGLLVYIDFEEGSEPDPNGELDFAYDRQGDLEGRFRGATERTDGLVGKGAAFFDGSSNVGVLLGDGDGIFEVDTGVTIEMTFTTVWEGGSLSEFFRKEDGNNRLLLSLQPDRFVGTFGNEHIVDGEPAIIGEPGVSGVSMGLNIDGVYGELDIAFDGEDGRPEIDGLADEQVHHIAGTYDSETGRNVIYLDGEVIGEVSLEGDITSGGGAQAIIGNVGTSEPFDGAIDEFAFWNRALSAEEVATHFANVRAGKTYFESAGPSALQAGDADQDFDFDQLDLVQVSVGGKYLTGSLATWGEGDWDGAPGGTQGSPPDGDKLFNQSDVISALNAGVYLTGPYASVARGGDSGDGQTSIVYDPATGELSVDPATGKELTSINITSAGSKFIGDKPTALDGAFDNFAGDNLFKATFGGSFGNISFGNVLPAEMSEVDVSADLSVVGSLAGGGDLGEVDLVYIPEPSTLLMTFLAAISVLFSARKSERL